MKNSSNKLFEICQKVFLIKLLFGIFGNDINTQIGYNFCIFSIVLSYNCSFIVKIECNNFQADQTLSLNILKILKKTLAHNLNVILVLGTENFRRKSQNQNGKCFNFFLFHFLVSLSGAEVHVNRGARVSKPMLCGRLGDDINRTMEVVSCRMKVLFHIFYN